MPYLTPPTPSGADVCAVIRVDADPYYRALIRGALLDLTRPDRWLAKFGLTADEAAAYFEQVLADLDSTWVDCPD